MHKALLTRTILNEKKILWSTDIHINHAHVKVFFLGGGGGGGGAYLVPIQARGLF